MDNLTAAELIPQAIKRLTELYEKHEADISDGHRNVLYWQIEYLAGLIQEMAGIPYDGPPLDSLAAGHDRDDREHEAFEQRMEQLREGRGND